MNFRKKNSGERFPSLDKWVTSLKGNTLSQKLS